jgi:dTDP-4-dehydrorhamnose 3,5-epimerase
MQLRATPIAGVQVVSIEPHHDHRGYFARTWCAREFEQAGLPARSVQTSLSHNLRRGTVRGMHTQLAPSQEGKLVSCIRGAIYDVVIDVRPESKTYMQHFGIELVAEKHDALFIPPMMLHGFQTLADHTEVFYQMTDFFAPELAFGARWNDPVFGIQWPVSEPITMVARDAEYPDFDPEAFRRRFVA